MCPCVLGEGREFRQDYPKRYKNEIMTRLCIVTVTVKREVNYYSLHEAKGQQPKQLVKDRSLTKDT